MDLKMTETNNGGDLIALTNDLALIEGFENMPYLALFGGNVRASTTNKRLENEQAYDWWGNNLLMPNDASLQLNSLTERTLLQVPLTSSGRIQIEQAIKKDLNFMTPFTIVNVTTSIISTDSILIGIQFRKPDNPEKKEFVYIWDATIQELYAVAFESQAGAITVKIFDQTFDFAFE